MKNCNSRAMHIVKNAIFMEIRNRLKLKLHESEKHTPKTSNFIFSKIFLSATHIANGNIWFFYGCLTSDVELNLREVKLNLVEKVE